MSEAAIRLLEEKDLEFIAKIQEDIIQRKVSEDWRRTVADRIKHRNEACLVAEQDGQVVGFMIGDIKIWNFGMEQSGWIEIIGVDPKFMGHGIGKKLGEELLKYFKSQNIKHVYTAARWDFGDLLSFFKSLGFNRSDFINLERKLD